MSAGSWATSAVGWCRALNSASAAATVLAPCPPRAPLILMVRVMSTSYM